MEINNAQLSAKLCETQKTIESNRISEQIANENATNNARSMLDVTSKQMAKLQIEMANYCMAIDELQPRFFYDICLLNFDLF